MYLQLSLKHIDNYYYDIFHIVDVLEFNEEVLKKSLQVVWNNYQMNIEIMNYKLVTKNILIMLKL